MMTKTKKSVFIAIWMVVSGLMIASCSTEKYDEITPVSPFEVERGFEEEFGLKSGNSSQNQLLAQIRRATAKYQRLDAAIADGYKLDSHCAAHPEFGGMGQHAVNMDRIVPFVVATEPPVLVYEPTQNGRYRLVAVEYIVPAAPWDAANNTPPMLGEVEFDDHREIIFVENEEGNLVPVNAKGGPPFPHYQLHVWVWKNNPNGMYFPFNPTVSCEYAMH